MINALVFPRTGDGIAGEIFGVDDDSLTVVGDTVYRLARTDIARIVVRTEVPRGRGFVYGACTGLVGWNFMLSAIDGQAPLLSAEMYGSYKNHRYKANSFLLAHHTLAVIAIFGGAGYFVDAQHSYGEHAFTIPTGAEEEQHSVWKELQDVLADNVETPIRFSVASAVVVPSMNHWFQSELSASGFDIDRERPFGYGEYLIGEEEYYNAAALEINILRRIQAMYQITPHVEVGLCVAWTSEPRLYAMRIIDSLRPGDVKRYYRARQKLSGSGYYACAMYDFGRYVDPRCNLRFGGGAGLATNSYMLDGVLWSHHANTAPEREQYSHFEYSGTAFSTIFLAECSWRVYDNLSLGLAADYVFTPSSRVIPVVPFLGLQEKQFAPGNGSIGVTFGLHF